MSRLPELACDSGDDYRRFFTPTPSLPEELARPRISIAQGCPDATAWDEDEARIVLPAHTVRYVRDLIGYRYLYSEHHAAAVALVLAEASRRKNDLPALTLTEVARCVAAAGVVYREQRAEYLAAWSPTIPESERAA